MEYLGFYGKAKVEKLEKEITELKNEILNNKTERLNKVQSLIEAKELILWESLNSDFQVEGLTTFRKGNVKHFDYIKIFLKYNKQKDLDLSELNRQELELIHLLVKKHNYII
jgi:hypothetical protein